VALNLQQKNITHQIPGKTIMASVSIHVDGTQDHPRLETPKNLKSAGFVDRTSLAVFFLNELKR